MNAYTVTWVIDIEATSPEAAALMAQEHARDPESIATIFTVVDTKTNEETTIDTLDL